MKNGLPKEFLSYAGTFSLGLAELGVKFPDAFFPASGNVADFSSETRELDINSLGLIGGPRLQRGVLCNSIASFNLLNLVIEAENASTLPSAPL